MDPSQLIAKYRGKGVLLDTNLMVPLAVGYYRRERISSFKRTDKYTASDFALVVGILTEFDRRVTTPHILAEADNLTRQLPNREHGAVAAIMTRIVEDLFEIYSPSVDAVRDERYSILGLTDCVTIAAADDILVITDDFPLFNILTHLGHDAININHIINRIRTL
jgi:hypothetical protein